MTPVEILQQHQIKKTTPRVAIIRALQKSASPLSENEIRDEMGELYDRITFYRSMQTMSEVGILHKIVVDNVTVKFALNNCDEGVYLHSSHAHFFCRQCNRLICLGSFEAKVETPEGYVQEESELLIKGVCKYCHTENE